MEVLQRREIKTDRHGLISGVEIPSWVESKAPDICVDRLQYALQEMLLWFADSETKQAGEIKDGRKTDLAFCSPGIEYELACMRIYNL